MVDIRTPRVPRRVYGLVLAVILLGGCITADGTLQQDGSATLTVSYPTVATTEDDQAARALVSGADVTIDALEITPAASGERGPRRATAKLSTKRVGAFERLALFGVIGTTIVHETKPDGSGSLRLKLQNTKPAKKNDPEVATMMKFPAMVRLRMPGPIVETSGTLKDGMVEWTFPAGDWSLGKSLELTVSYGPAPSADTPASDAKQKEGESKS